MSDNLEKIQDRLEVLARKAELLALAIGGVMLEEGNENARPLREAAQEIQGELLAIAKRVSA